MKTEVILRFETDVRDSKKDCVLIFVELKTALCPPRRLAIARDSIPRTCSEGQRDRRELCVHAYLRADTRAYNAHIYHADGIISELIRVLARFFCPKNLYT